MSPKQRLQMVQRVTDEKERQHARKLAQSRTRVAQCEAKLKELQGYRADYVRDFDKRAAAGIRGAGIREFQAFLAKLAEAIRQQEELLEKAQADSEAERTHWQGAAQRSQIMDKVVEHHTTRETKARDRREQREIDDRGQRTAKGRLDSGGN
ncbi:MAG TPA: flagellar export protein FliJ [Steroidobacteraceae bacterium]|jgi:flagellar FliJ protein|nr:flagellar export protein FliJ [Steroidobacteraceae bacterium]